MLLLQLAIGRVEVGWEPRVHILTSRGLHVACRLPVGQPCSRGHVRMGKQKRKVKHKWRGRRTKKTILPSLLN